VKNLIEAGGAKVDYFVASAAVAAAPFSIYLEQLNVYLATVGLIFGLVLAGLRMRRQWKFRNEPPGKT
jgi:hypothetical protein